MSESTNSLFPTRAMFNAIGCLLKEPLLIHDGKFRLERNDFITSKQSKFHMILFATIENLVDKGLTTIQPSDMDEYLSKYPEHYQVFNDNDGVEWCYSAIENAQVRNYEVFVEEIKKYSLLRELQAEGLDINEIYPLDNDDDNLRSQFDKMTIDDILKFYEDKINKVSSSYHIGYDRQKSKAGDNGVELYNSFKETPLYGFPTVGKAQNTIFRGMPTKTSMLRSALTNSGKTRIAIAEATDLAIGKWYEHDPKHPSKSGWRDKGAKKKVLFISTEMEESELQPTMWAYTSGVAEEEIVDGKLNEKDEQIVMESIKHLQECDLFIEYVPKFDPQTINAIVKEYAVKHDIDVVFFDYIHLSFEIMMELSNKTRGMTMREDMMLTIFASGLEELAREYNFHLRTSTQMNGEQTDQTNQMLDQRLLRGAKAMADKMQYGVIMARPTPKELQLVEYHKLFPDVAYGKFIEPNMVYHIYKNRMTKYKGKLWLHIDFGTMRVQELFFTDFQNRQIDVPLTELSEALEE